MYKEIRPTPLSAFDLNILNDNSNIFSSSSGSSGAVMTKVTTWRICCMTVKKT